jgi:hypothetical protein
MEPEDTAVKMIATDGAVIVHPTTHQLNQAAAEASERVKYPDKVDHNQLWASRPLTPSCLAKTVQ